MKIKQIICIVLMSLLLAACGSSSLDRRYLDSSTEKNLEIPPDLFQTEVDAQFVLPASISGDRPDKNKIPVLAKVDSMQLQGYPGFYWLSVDEPVDNLYAMVKNFWGSEGYRLRMDEPAIATMKTEWVVTNQGAREKGASWLSRLFQSDDLTAIQDQFKTRIERDSNGNSSRIYVAHRGSEYQHVISKEDDAAATSSTNRWRARQPDPELEVEMLARMMIYLGLEQSRVDQQVARITLFKPRAFMHVDADENAPYLLLKDSYNIAWNRVFHQLERMNFTIVDTDFNQSLSNEGAITFTLNLVEQSGETGFLSLFRSKKGSSKDVVVVIAEESNELAKVFLETLEGDLIKSDEGAKLLSLLHQNLK